MLIALIVVLVWALACLGFDLYNTNKGLRAGIAQEGNELITSLWKTKTPTLKQLAAVEVPIRLGIFGAGFIPGGAAYPYTFAVLALVALALYGLRNIKGGREWLWMFRNPGKTVPVANTVWQKIIGIWV